MGRRKKRKKIYKKSRKLPKIFTCPSCGSKSVKIEKKIKLIAYSIKCVDCGLEWEAYLRSANELYDINGENVKNCSICGGKLKKTELKDKIVNLVEVKCGTCGLQKEVLARSIEVAVDFYGSFIDLYFKDQEYHRLKGNVKEYKKEKNWSELALTYSLLSDITKMKASELSKEYISTGEEELLEESNKWRDEAANYHLLERELREKIKQEGTGVDLEEEIEVEEKLAKDKTLEEVFDDPGFLEW